MHQREVLESTPGFHCEEHCFHASAFTPRNKSAVKVAAMWKLWTRWYWHTVQCARSLKQHLIIQCPNELRNRSCEHKLFTCSYLESSQRVDEVNNPPTALPTQVIICGVWSSYNILQSVVPCCYRLLSDLPVLTVFERGTLCEVSGEDYMWQIWRGNQEKTNRQLNAWEMSQRSDRRR